MITRRTVNDCLSNAELLLFPTLPAAAVSSGSFVDVDEADEAEEGKSTSTLGPPPPFPSRLLSRWNIQGVAGNWVEKWQSSKIPPQKQWAAVKTYLRESKVELNELNLIYDHEQQGLIYDNGTIVVSNGPLPEIKKDSRASSHGLAILVHIDVSQPRCQLLH